MTATAFRDDRWVHLWVAAGRIRLTPKGVDMTVLDDLHAAWNAHDPKRIAACYTDNGVREEFLVTHARVQARDAVAAQVQLYLDAVPDAALEFRNTFSDGGDVTTIEWTFQRPPHRRRRRLAGAR